MEIDNTNHSEAQQEKKQKWKDTLKSVLIGILVALAYFAITNMEVNNSFSKTNDVAEIEYENLDHPQLIKSGRTDGVCLYKDINPFSFDILAIKMSFIGILDNDSLTAWGIRLLFGERLKKVESIHDNDYLSLYFTDNTNLTVYAQERNVERGSFPRRRKSVVFLSGYQMAVYRLSNAEMRILGHKTIETVVFQTGTKVHTCHLSNDVSQQIKERYKLIVKYIREGNDPQ